MRNLKGQFQKGFKHSEETKQKMRGRTPWILGKKHSAESIEKMRITHKGKSIHTEKHKKELSEKMKGNKLGVGFVPSIQWREKQHNKMVGNKYSLNKKNRLGTIQTEETRKKISVSRTGKYSREKHSNWKGGISPYMSILRGSKEAFRWKNQVKKRDNWQCKIKNSDCSGNLEVHHILRFSEYPELRFDVNNGITLCKFHHPTKKSEENSLKPYFISLINKS